MNGDEMKSHETTDQRVALYVAGAMTPEEQREFENQLESDSELRSAVRSFDSACDALIDQVAPVRPDESQLQDILSQIEQRDSPRVSGNDSQAPIIQRRSEAQWEPTGVPGVTMRMLHRDLERKRMTLLMKLEAGATYPAHAHEQDEECLVFEGDLDFGEYQLEAGDYLRMKAGSEHGEIRSRGGCICLVTAALPDSMVA
ncbi:MAG: cupin domain-containing protein [Planctomycetota bacterium]